MKDLKHLEFWLKKRNELPVKGDPNADWLKMQAVLNKHMPSSGNIKKPYNPRAIKWLYKLLIGFSAVIVVYKGGQLLLSNTMHTPVTPISEKNLRVPPAISPVSTVKASPIFSIDSSKLSPQRNIAMGNVMPAAGISKTAPITLPDDTSLLKQDVKVQEAPERPKTDLLEIRGKSIKDALDSSSFSIKPGVFKPLHDSVTVINKPLSPGRVSNKATQNTLSDSLRKAKKKRRKIGIFL